MSMVLFSLLVRAATTSASCDTVQLLQQAMVHQELNLYERPPTNRSDAGLKDLALQLLHAKEECLSCSLDCLAALKQVRYRTWFFLQDLVHPKLKSWPILDLHPQVLRSEELCHVNSTVLFLDLSTKASAAVRKHMETSSKLEVVKAFEDDVHWCENLQLDQLGVTLSRRKTFTFVQDPLARFIQAYANIDGAPSAVPHQGVEFLQEAEKGSVERAKLFMERFVKYGVGFSSQVKPQSEHLAPLSRECALKMDFIGKVEHFATDFKHFLETELATPVCGPLFGGMQMNEEMVSNESRAMREFVNLAQSKRSDIASSMAAMKTALIIDDAAYLRAFCWIHLADYVMFDYELPEKCDEEEMLKIMALTKELPKVT